MHKFQVITPVVLMLGLSFHPVADRPQEPRSTTFTFSKDPRGSLLVSCRIDEAYDSTLVLDTGSGNHALSEDFVRRNRLTMRPPIGSDGRPITMDFPPIKVVGIAELTNIRIGTDTLFRGPDALVLEDRAIRRMSDGAVDGILAMRTFTYTSILFDFQRKSVTVYYPSTLSAEELRQAGMDGAAEIPIEMRKDQAYVTLNFGADQKESLCIDTGAVHTGIPAGLAARLGLKPRSHYEGASLGGNQKVAEANVPTVRLGDMIVKDLAVQYTDKGKLELPPHLGQDVLSRFRVLIDVPGKKMYLKSIVGSTEDKKD